MLLDKYSKKRIIKRKKKLCQMKIYIIDGPYQTKFDNALKSKTFQGLNL